MLKNIIFKNIKQNQLLKRDSKVGTKTNSKYQKKHGHKIAEKYEIGYIDSYNIPKAYVFNQNAFFTYSGFIYFYPPNDGTSKLPFYYYQDHNLVFKNTNAYSEIENLDELLIEMVKLYSKALDDKITFNPFCFMLKLEDEIEENYQGKASLVLTDQAIVKPNNSNMEYFINRFLDHFIGWNFGLSVNRNEELKNELIKLNTKVIDKGLRKDAGPGYGVYGTEFEVYHGLQHFYLPTTREEAYVMSKKQKKNMNS